MTCDVRTHLGNELHVEWAGNLQLAPDGATNQFDLLQRLLVEVLRRSDERGVSGVDASILNMLAHSHTQHLSLHGHRIHIYLLQVKVTTHQGHMTLTQSTPKVLRANPSQVGIFHKDSKLIDRSHSAIIVTVPMATKEWNKEPLLL